MTAEEAQEKYPGPSQFVHLHNHTLFSILDGVAQPEQYFKGCVERDWPAFAITEHGVLNSVSDAYFAAKEHKRKYIVGCEVYFNDYEPLRRDRLNSGWKMADIKKDDEELAMRMTRNRHLTVLCKNMTGYTNLLEINKQAWEFGFYYRPRVWFDLLAKYHEGLIILSGCLNGPVCHELRMGNLNSKGYVVGAVDYIDKFHKVFGEDYYIELQMPCIQEINDVKVFRQLVAIADIKGIKTVISNDCHYLDRRDFQTQKIMMAISQGTTVDDPNLFHVNSSEQYFKTRYELRATFQERGYGDKVPLSVFEQACDNSLEIADKCDTFKPNMEPKLPRLKNAEQELAKLCNKALVEKGHKKDKNKYLVDGREVTYAEQTKIELERFIKKGFASYFLITRDLIKCSHDNDWPLGPARGSAGGSLVCYLLGIQSLDPLKWGTSFNRFLSPSRGGYMLKVTM